MTIPRPEPPPPTFDDLAGMAEAMVTFRHVVREGSLTRAAAALGTTKSAVSKRLARLEDRLGVRLLDRTARGLSLTEAGEAFHERAGEVLEALHAAAAEASTLGGEPRGTLRVSAPVLFGERMIAPLLASYAERHPRVKLVVALSDRFVDLVEEGFDCAVRIGESPDAELVARRIGRMPIVTVAAPGYVARHGAPRRPADVERHVAIGYTLARKPEEWRYGRAGQTRVRPRVEHEVSHGGLARALALRGFGLAALPLFIVAQDLRAGALVEVLAEQRPPALDVSVVFVARRHVPAKVRSFVDEAVRVLGPLLRECEVGGAEGVSPEETGRRRARDSRPSGRRTRKGG